MNVKHTFENFISFDDIILAASLGTNKLTPEGIALQFAIWDNDSLDDAVNSVELLCEHGATFNKTNVIGMVEKHYEK